jgi:hypothetical protein
MLLMLFKVNNVYLPFAKHSPYASDSAELRTIIGVEILLQSDIWMRLFLPAVQAIVACYLKYLCFVLRAVLTI